MGTWVDLGGQEHRLIGQVGMHALMTLHTARLPFFSNTAILTSSLDGNCLLIHLGFVQPRPVRKLATFFQMRSCNHEPTTSPRQGMDVALELKFGRRRKKRNQGKVQLEILVQPEDFSCGNIRSKADSTAAEQRGVRISSRLPQLADEMLTTMRNLDWYEYEK